MRMMKGMGRGWKALMLIRRWRIMSTQGVNRKIMIYATYSHSPIGAPTGFQCPISVGWGHGTRSKCRVGIFLIMSRFGQAPEWDVLYLFLCTLLFPLHCAWVQSQRRRFLQVAGLSTTYLGNAIHIGNKLWLFFEGSDYL